MLPAPAEPPGIGPADALFSGAGVVGADCGIGGRVSSSDAPNDEVGLNALIPALKPVACGRSGEPVGWLENAVLPVGCPLTDPKSVSEKAEPVVVDVAALVGVETVVPVPGPDVVNDVVSCGTGGLPELPARNEDATLVKVVTGAPVC